MYDFVLNGLVKPPHPKLNLGSILTISLFAVPIPNLSIVEVDSGQLPKNLVFVLISNRGDETPLAKAVERFRILPGNYIECTAALNI